MEEGESGLNLSKDCKADDGQKIKGCRIGFIHKFKRYKNPTCDFRAGSRKNSTMVDVMKQMLIRRLYKSRKRLKEIEQLLWRKVGRRKEMEEKTLKRRSPKINSGKALKVKRSNVFSRTAERKTDVLV